ncbi:synaptonemal complex central element protein 3 [Notolabrus celidotus]|uniref:synaptonemal complex central element protein 3 n=1 Tax=Notolabrus celidotus TaxID=1203425 RepID=UPI0014907A15|nr:synaptonemal complex central element protein 3 [Notolabrus celidotus]
MEERCVITFSPTDSCDNVEFNSDVERMIENVENISVQLTWMNYDMVALRTSPELGSIMQKLEEAFNRCRAAVYRDEQLESSENPDSTGTALNHQM